MANTGVTVSDDVIAQFTEFKLGKMNPKPKFLIYHIVDGMVVTEQIGENAGADSFNSLIEKLPENDCRFVVYDMDFQSDDGRPVSKIVLIAWSPDVAKVRSKMLYSGTKEAVKRALHGIATNVNATDMSELTEEIVITACKQFVN